MKSADFSALAVGDFGDERGAARRGFGGAGEAAADADPSTKTRGKRAEDALGTTGVERVERQGCPHCAGREIVGGPVGRAVAVSLQELRAHLQCVDQDTDGASAQEGEMARSRPGDDRGRKPGEDRATVRGPSTTAFRWRHRFLRAPSDDKPRRFTEIVEADETFILNLSRAVGPICRARRESAAERPGMRAFTRTTFPSSSPATGKARRWTPCCRRPTAPDRRRAEGDRDPRQSSRRRWRQGDGRFRPKSQDCLSTLCRRRESRLQSAAPAHQQCQCRPQPPQAMAQPLQRRRHQEPA